MPHDVFLTDEDDAALGRIAREFTEVRRLSDLWGSDRRPMDEAELEAFLNLSALTEDLVKRRDAIVTDALRRWPGWKDFETLKRERLQARADARTGKG